jgi:cytidine deaminase
MASTVIQDKEDIQLANDFRLSLSKPSQSSFRVLALLFYAEAEESTSSGQSSASRLPPWLAQTTKDGRKYMAGANDEPGYMGGAICAERSAMVQLRFVPSFRVTKLVICTDSLEPIAPGMLCREFLAGHDSVPWDLRVLSTGCICTKCQKRDEELFTESSSSEAVDGNKECIDGTEHAVPRLETTLEALYPYPSPYTRLTSSASVSLGEAYSNADQADSLKEALDDTSKRLLELAILEARSNSTDSHPIHFGAAVAFEDGTIITSHQSSALEYGCTLDAVSQLVAHFDEGVVPTLLVQADQYGVAHTPFAPARSFLSEHGYGDCLILLHEAPIHDVSNIASWSFRQIPASNLAPNAPSWTTSTDRH